MGCGVKWMLKEMGFERGMGCLVNKVLKRRTFDGECGVG